MMLTTTSATPAGWVANHQQEESFGVTVIKVGHLPPAILRQRELAPGLPF